MIGVAEEGERGDARDAHREPPVKLIEVRDQDAHDLGEADGGQRPDRRP